jgi:hypothetical protein
MACERRIFFLFVIRKAINTASARLEAPSYKEPFETSMPVNWHIKV